MASVMLDNWGLSNCAWRVMYGDKYRGSMTGPGSEDQSFYGCYYERNSDHDVCWNNFLTSLVLWDHICLYNDKLSPSYSYEEIEYFLKTVEDQCGINGVFQTVSSDDVPGTSSTVYNIQKLYESQLSWGTGGWDTELLLRGFKYLSRANELGYNYLPHPRRAKLITDSGFFEKGFDRIRYLELLEEDVRKYVEDVNALLGFQLKTVHFPLLYNFIFSQAGSTKEELQVALELRDDKNVKAFRQSINQIENDFSKGNLMALHASMLETKEICDAITSEMYSKPWSFGVSLALSPSVNIDGEVQGKVRSKLHTTFLYDLASFAIKGETKRKYKLDIK